LHVGILGTDVPVAQFPHRFHVDPVDDGGAHLAARFETVAVGDPDDVALGVLARLVAQADGAALLPGDEVGVVNRRVEVERLHPVPPSARKMRRSRARRSTRSSRTAWPRPGPSGTRMVPSPSTLTGGSMMSSCQ